MKGWRSVCVLAVLASMALPAGAQPEPAPSEPPPAEPQQPLDLTNQGTEAPAQTQAPQAAPAQAAPAPPAGPPPGYAPAPYGGYPGYPGYEPPPPPPPPPEPDPRRVSLTVSPLHLIFPVFEAMVEVRPIDHLGIAGIFGYGQASFELERRNMATGQTFKEDVTVDVLELGAQLVWYPLEPFDSLQLGAELLWVSVEADEVSGTTSGVAVGLGIGPFVGYKLITSGGFTLLVQGGAQYVIATADPEDTTTGVTTHEEKTATIFLLNFNLGWSF